MWADALERVLVVLAATAAVSYLARRALTSRARVERDGHLVLQYPEVLRWLGPIGSALLLVLVGFIPAMARTEPQTPFSVVLLSAVGLGLGFLGVYGVLEFPFVRLDVRDDGLHSRTPWRSRRFISWQDIDAVSFSTTAQWFVIRARSGTTIRAHLYLSGIRELYTELRRRLPRAAWEKRYPPFEPAASRGHHDV